MNLVQQSEQLKNLPDAALLQMQQRPTTVPPYLVVAEMQRRETMRKAAQDQGGQNPMDRKTVSQEMVGQMQQQAPAAPPQQIQGGMGAMKMAGGGLADLSSYFQQMQGPTGVPTDGQMIPVAPPMQYPGDPDAPAMSSADIAAKYAPARSSADEFQSIKQLRGESPLKALAESLASQEKETRNRKPKLGEILMQLGLGMAGSRNNSFLGALADGGQSALQGYTQDRNRREGQADEIQRRRIGIMGQIDQNDDQMMHEAAAIGRGNTATRKNEIATVEASRRQAANARGDEARAAAQREHSRELADINDKRARDLAAAKSADDEAKTAEKYAHEEKLAKIRAAGKAAKSSNPESQNNFKVAGVYTKIADSLSKRADSLAKQSQDIALSTEEKKRLADQAIKIGMQSEQMRGQALGLYDDVLTGGKNDIVAPPKKPKAPPAPRGLMQFSYPALGAMK